MHAPSPLVIPPLPRHKVITIEDLVRQADRAHDVLMQVRGEMLKPSAVKEPPVYSVSALAHLCGVDSKQVAYRLTKGDLPAGTVIKGNRRQFTLAEALVWIQAYRAAPPRPDGQPALTIAVANFKGGVGKTTTAMTIAQGLTLRGYKVLVIDLDPQGSLTSLFGIVPDAEIVADQTVLPLIRGQERSLRYAIHESYWPSLDFVPANTQLFDAEFFLPAQQVKNPNFAFWSVLDRGLEDVRAEYDVIVIDTAPALSYLTINALMAANGILIPLPPSPMAFSSSVQFWSLYSDLAAGLKERMHVEKTYDFVHVMLSKVVPGDATGRGVQEMIQAAYAEKVFPVEILKTVVAEAAAAEFGTVYDIVKYEGDARTYQRARDAYDWVNDRLDQILVQCWQRRISDAGEGQ